jgi:hypothetical protein
MKKSISTVAAVLIAFSFITSLSVAEVRAEGPEGVHSEKRIERKIEKKKEMKKAIRKEKKKEMKKEIRQEEKKNDRR